MGRPYRIPLCLMILTSLLSVGGSRAWARGGKSFTVVLDAGHGGKDPGAMGYGGREKDITLAIVKLLGQMIKEEHPKVKVLYTRESDVFVGLQARADFANRHKASLFMSVHVNSARGTGARGTETYVLGLSKHSNNLSVAMRENEAILLEDDYKTTYRGFNPRSTESYIMFDLMQEAYLGRSIEMAELIERQYKRLGRYSRGVRQDGFWVLSQSAMPSILTEVGFISNPSDASYLKSDHGQREIARALSRAFTAFYKGADGATTDSGADSKSHDKATSPDTSTTPESPHKGDSDTTAVVAESTSPSEVTYRIQIMSSPRKLETTSREFARLGRRVYREREGSVYKYTTAETSSLAEARQARRAVAKVYKDCFIVEYQQGKRIGSVH